MKKNSTVTIFGFDKSLGKYQNNGSFPAWVYRSERIRNRGNGARKCDSITVRIEAEYQPRVCAGDLIFFGICRLNEPQIAKCSRIAKVTENSFGLSPHWCIEAENEYR